MRAIAARFTLLGLGLLAATGCSSGAGGGYASSRPGWHWPWSKSTPAAETAVAANAQPQAPQLPSQMAQAPQPGTGYPQNYYSGTPTDAYAQNPNGVGYSAPTSYGAPAASTGLYDSQTQPGAMAQGTGYPPSQPAGYAQQAAVPGAYGDPAAAGVTNEYYNPAYARPDANVAAAAPATGYAQPGYGAVEPGQAPQGYDAQAAAALPANPPMPQTSYPEAQMADSRYATTPAAPAGAYEAAPAQPSTDRYGLPAAAAPAAGYDAAAASTTAGQYNEPSGFQPGATGYTPGANGYQPAGTTPYQAPAGAYTPSPTGSRYRPGSTGDYYAPPTSTTPAPTRTSSTGSAVAPANYVANPHAAPAEAPAVYTPAASEAGTTLPQ